jgi:hypothetical protein
VRGDLYSLPPEVLAAIRKVMCRDLSVFKAARQ